MAYYLLHSGQPSARRLMRRVNRLTAYQSSNIIANADVVIRWGSAAESDPLLGKVLNPKDAVDRTSSRVQIGRLFRRVGIRFPTNARLSGDSELRFLRQYRVPMFDLQPLALFRSDSSNAWMNRRIQQVQDSFREVSLGEDKVATRVLQLASRALHALGLDHGMVSIGMAQKGVLHVIDVTANPVLDARLLDLYAKAINDFIDKEEQSRNQAIPQVMLGTDVEVMLRNAAGKMVLASRYFSRKGKIGCDDRSVQFDGKRLPLMELRPDPDPSPLGLLNNLKDLMSEASQAINRPKVEWRAGSMPFRPYCTGGHIHFSGVPYSSQLVRVLDIYLGLPLFLVENRQTAALRRPKYGFLGDVRHKSYGGFEYRTPASFVADLDVTAAAFCIAHLIALHHRDLPVWDIYEPGLQLAFYSGKVDAILPMVERAFTMLRRVPTYERYRDYIEPMYELIDKRRTWDENADVRVTWGIPLSKPQPRARSRRGLTGTRAIG